MMIFTGSLLSMIGRNKNVGRFGSTSVLTLSEETNKSSTQSMKSSAADDENIDPTQYFKNRLKYLATQKADGNNPYPHKFSVQMSILEYIEKYQNLNDGDHLVDISVIGSNTDLTKDEFETFHSSVKRGDIVGVVGFTGRKLLQLVRGQRKLMYGSLALHGILKPMF